MTVVPVAEVSAKAKYTFGDITPNGGVASFTDGASYYVMRSNNAENDNNGKFMATDFYGDVIYADSAYYLPATQWTVKEVATGTYTIKADGFRDFFVGIACCCETAKNNYLCSLNGLSINRIIV